MVVMFDNVYIHKTIAVKLIVKKLEWVVFISIFFWVKLNWTHAWNIKVKDIKKNLNRK